MTTKRQKYNMDITGQKFGHLTVIRQCGKDDKGYRLFVCRCECGRFTKGLPIHRLRSKNTKSCGCKKFGSKSDNGWWSGYGDLSGTQWGTIKEGAKKRDIEFNITIEYVWELFLKQNRKCALTGLDLIMKPGDHNNVDSSQPYASLDRIDSNKGYVKDNIQWVHKKVNLMKNILEQKEFIQLCKLIGDNN
jgi:hypothetical protein